MLLTPKTAFALSPLKKNKHSYYERNYKVEFPVFFERPSSVFDNVVSKEYVQISQCEKDNEYSNRI